MNFILAGKAKDVFGRLAEMQEASEKGGNIFYEGARFGQDPGNINITRIEIGSTELAGMPARKVNMRPFDAGPSQALYNHSPDGFEWGYWGSGPAQLALALLLDATGDKLLALKYHQDFKEKYVAGWGLTWRIDADQIKRWVKLRQFHEHLAAAAGDEETVY